MIEADRSDETQAELLLEHIDTITGGCGEVELFLRSAAFFSFIDATDKSHRLSLSAKWVQMPLLK